VRVREGGKPGVALNAGTIITCIIYAVMLLALVFLGHVNIGIFWAAFVGILAGVIIGFTSDYFTSDEHKPVQQTARESTSGSAITIITGLSYGLISILPSILGVVIATLVSFNVTQANGLPGVYGIGIAAVGMLSISGMIVSADAYGPIVDNAAALPKWQV